MKFTLFIAEKKSEAVLLVPDLKTMVKWTLVLIYGTLYITAYYQGKIIFKIHTGMVFNEFLGKRFTYPSFSRSVNKMGGFRFWIESDSWRVSFCFISLYVEAIL